MSLGMVDQEVIHAQRAYYFSKGMDGNRTSLIEGLIIIRDHQSITANLFSCLWWRQLLMFPSRDQPSTLFVFQQLCYKANVTHEVFTEAAQVYAALMGMTKDSRWLQSCRYEYKSDMFPGEKVYAFPFCQVNRIGIQQDHRRPSRSLL
jgi:hypothetical protein